MKGVGTVERYEHSAKAWVLVFGNPPVRIFPLAPDPPHNLHLMFNLHPL